MTSSAPRVSVLIPTYDRRSWLAGAVESVLGQTFRDLEVIVCDDGSTDDPSDLLSGYGARVRHLRFEHTGSPGGTRNRGLEVARGELIAFLDDDDLWDPEKLALQVAVMDANPAAGLVYTDARLLLPDGSESDPVL
ncbi:MAG TPA: glycosyltransferase family A protein, partial [Longimicrobiaceae bacterium]|nr:glycosyltransferase family A protein [Longimicrobiaceae bacterium]